MWKKCEPSDASSGKSSMLVSMIIRALEMCDHFTGIPIYWSAVPQRPGPISIYSSFASIIPLFNSSSSTAISLVLSLSKASSLTNTASLTSVILPFPMLCSA